MTHTNKIQISNGEYKLYNGGKKTVDFIDHLYATITITTSDSRKLFILAPVVFHSISFTLTFFFLFQLIFFLSHFLDPHHLFSFPSIIASAFVLIHLAILFLFRVSGIFFLTLSVSSPSYLGILIAQRLRVLFRLSFAQLMQQRLGKNPFFYAEVKDLLSSCIVQKFPVITNVSWRSCIDYPCSKQASAFLFHRNGLTVVSNCLQHDDPTEILLHSFAIKSLLTPKKKKKNPHDDPTFNSFTDCLLPSFPLGPKAKPNYFPVAY